MFGGPSLIKKTSSNFHGTSSCGRFLRQMKTRGWENPRESVQA